MPSDSSLKAFLSSLSPEDVATLFTGLRNTLPTGMAVYSPELNAGEAEVIAKRQAEREAARVREMEILTRLLPQAMAKRQAAIPESGADPFVPTRPRIMKESPFMFTQPQMSRVPQQYADGGPVTPDHTQPDMSDGGQMIADPNLYAGGGSVFGKKSLDEMQAELLSKEGLSRRALFGLKPDYPLAKTPEPLSKVEQEVKRAEQAARSQGQAPSVTASRVDVDPGTGSKKSLMQSVTETPVSRRTVLKTAGSQVAQNMLPMGDIAKALDVPMPTSVMRTAAPAVTADLAPALMIKAIQMGMNEDQAVKYVREALKGAAPTKTYDLSRAPEALPGGGTFDTVQSDLGILYDTMVQPLGASEKFEFFGPMRPSNTLSLLMGAKDVENPSVMQMRGALRQIREADPQRFRSLINEARDLAQDYGQQAIESGMISPKNLERYMKGKDIEPQYRPGALSQ